jgi:hypothetical protein
VIRVGGAMFLALRALAHILGFASAWRLAEFPDVPYTTWIANGTADVGAIGIRVVGLLWVAACAAMLSAAALVWRRSSRASAALVGAAVLSLVMCVIGLPAAAIGAAIDVVILAILTVGSIRPTSGRVVNG